MDSLKITTSDGVEIQTYSWLPPGKPLAILQIAHGMQEHAQRYDHFARWMNRYEVAVYAHDHIGHGSSVRSMEDISHFPRKDDWQRSVDILHLISGKIKEDHPGIPLIVLGHSMGSALVQSYMIRFGKEADGYILSGAIRQSMFLATVGVIIVQGLAALFRWNDRSRLIISLGYGQYNKYFKPNRTECDWLCRDNKIVDEYISSPLCGVPLTNSFYLNFFRGFRHIASHRNLKKIPNGKPVLIIAGKSDPAGFFGKAPVKISQLLTEYAKAKVDLKLYPDCRHEILNEINKEEVYNDILRWIRK
jgi:alpha-beta hydrolase superfamily lysophospholipase